MSNMTVNEIIKDLRNIIDILTEQYCEYCQEFDCDYCSRRVEERKDKQEWL